MILIFYRPSSNAARLGTRRRAIEVSVPILDAAYRLIPRRRLYHRRRRDAPRSSLAGMPPRDIISIGWFGAEVPMMLPPKMTAEVTPPRRMRAASARSLAVR